MGVIEQVRAATRECSISVRYHAEDRYAWLAETFPALQFRFWRMNDCARDNEDRVVLEPKRSLYTLAQISEK